MRKLLKRTALAILIFFVIAQIPFAYRRYEVGKVAETINRLETKRVVNEDSKYNEYKGIIHAHTSLGGHSTGSFDELIAAANANDLDFVLMTEHWSDNFDTSALTLNGVYGKTLFIGGNEIDTADGDRFLMIPGSADAAGLRKMPTAAVLEKLHAENRLALITYPEKFRSWDSNFDGDEVFSLHTSAKSMNPLTAVFDMVWSYPAYPELTLARYFKRPDENLRKYDEIAAGRKISLFAGSDAHSNLGFHFFGDDAGNRLLNIKLDRYETIFRLVRLHVLIEKDKPFNKDTLMEAIKYGRFFIGFDALGDTTGFRFRIQNGSEVANLGDTISFSPNLKLAVTPGPVVREVFRNGSPFGGFPPQEEFFDHGKVPMQPGIYRMEVYRSDLGPPFDKVPWILSNPIYVR